MIEQNICCSTGYALRTHCLYDQNLNILQVLQYFSITNYISFRNPTPEKDEVLQNLIWSKSTPNNFNYLDIDTDLSIKTDMKQGRYKKWMELFEKEALPPRVVV